MEAVYGLIGGALGTLLGYFSGRKLTAAQVNNTNANTVDLQSKTILNLWGELDKLRNDFEESQKLNEQKDDEIGELKEYVREILAWMDSKGIKDYPKPKREDLLNTNPRIRAIRKQ